MTASNIFDPRPTPYFDENGELASGAKAYFFLANTNTPLTVYTEQTLTTAHLFPVVAGSNGVFPVIYLPYTDYRVLVRSANDITLFDAPYVPNPAPPSAGGSIPVTSGQVFQTGFTNWMPMSGPLTGWARMNGRTIGPSGSGATEYAGADAKDLFSWIWNRIGDLYAPVSGGRGVSADDDWLASKTIAVPSMRGRAAVGADTMGNNAAGVIQVSTTVNVTNGSAAATVASATNLARGMICIIDGSNVYAISAISGTTITLSGTYAGTTNASADFRASFFSDAQAPGATGGSQVITQTPNEMPSHTHTITDVQHSHNYTIPSTTIAGAGINTVGSVGASTATSSSYTGITGTNSNGSGLPMSNVSPGMVGTWFMKL